MTAQTEVDRLMALADIYTDAFHAAMRHDGGLGFAEGLVAKAKKDALRAELARVVEDAERWRTYSAEAQSTWEGHRLGEWLQFDAVMQHGSRNAAIDIVRAAIEQARAQR